MFFRLVVTNTGNETLTGITLSDTDFATSGCTIPATLAPAASFTCVLGPQAAIAGQHSDTATVTAQGQTSGTPVSDADPAHYVATGGSVAAVPTLSQWGALLLSALLGLLALAAVRLQHRR